MVRALLLALALLLVEGSGIWSPALADEPDVAPTVSEAALAAPDANTALTASEAAKLLQAAVVAVNYSGKTICSAAKIGPTQYLTAQHCLAFGEKVELPNGRLLKIVSILTSLEEKAAVKDSGSSRGEDWAIFNVAEEDNSVTALELGCTEELYLGQGIAYAGYPFPTQFAFGTGHITGVMPLLREVGGGNDFQTDVHAAPGASGSAVISLDTGKIVGILTEGVPSRIGFFMVGMESVKSLDACSTATAATKPVAPTADALAK
jgi:V8-like Glu-specific endopeptidase